MPYNLQMSPAQIARCNRALAVQHHIAAQHIVRHVNGGEHRDEAVVLDAQGIQRIIDALRDRPEPCDTEVACLGDDLEATNLALLADTLELVLDEAEQDPNILHGVCI